MSIPSILYTLIISPLELLLEVIFTVADKIIGNAGLSIIFLSIVVNFLVLPLYKRADELQAEERDIQAKMAYRIKRTKETFKGDERFMMLQEYYRINHYKPIYALKSSASLLLQIPFFIAAYRLLSGMQSLNGMQFGFISDLGKEDASFMIGSFPVNVLPILMTLINIVSGIIYTKGQPLKSKIQVYGLAVVFLVLLYHSPSGLVFYWLLNNVFSLVKNIFYKLRNPKKVLNILLAVAGVVVLVLTAIRPDLDMRQKTLLGIGSVLLCAPFLSGLAKKKISVTPLKATSKDNITFFGGTLFMACFTGLLIPSTVINTSPYEFIDLFHIANPALYIVSSAVLALGSWVLWGGIFYFFMNEKMRAVFSRGIWMICGISVVDYMLFGTKLGVISSTLQYENNLSFAITDYMFNALVVILIGLVFLFIISRFHNAVNVVVFAGVMAVVMLGSYKIYTINKAYDKYTVLTAPSEEVPEIPLSKDGKNVIVLMLDRGMGTQLPYILNEKPELKEQFDGFTYYPNTISFGAYTNFATPALFGGYEYTPERINERDDMRLVDKQNEALKVMPYIFGDNGYEVTICDPPYAGYTWVPDLSIYDERPEFNCYITNARFSIFDDDETGESSATSERVNNLRNRNFFFFSIMKISPLILQETIYDDGSYNESVSATGNSSLVSLSPLQHVDSLSTATGLSNDFLNSYPVLTNLPEITVINNSGNTFLMLANETTHSPCLLQEPDYVPALVVDNTAYDTEDWVTRYTVDGVTMEMSDVNQVMHYHVNMAALLQLGEWFDYLRENGVFDNTRIIIVADHGRELSQFNITCNGEDMERFMPLLLVKDFNSTGFTVSEEFMTNADVPELATSGLIDDPRNPFTGTPINSELKNEPQTVFFSMEADTPDNNGNTFLPGSWYVFEGGDPHDPENWTYLGDY